MNVVFAGSIGRFPVGGHAWVDLQYLLGLRDLGHRVTYLEDCGAGSWVYNWQTEELVEGVDYPTRYLRECLAPVGLGDRWCYRAGDRFVGMSPEALRAACADADLLVIRGAPLDVWRPEYDLPRRRAFVDSDPGFVQMRAANGHPSFRLSIDRSERLFTVGQRVGKAGCDVPLLGREWVTLVPPVHLGEWPLAGDADPGAGRDFTTVMQWRSYSEVEYEGRRYGNKDREFDRFLTVPQRSARPFRIALTGSAGSRLREAGWQIDVGWAASLTTDAYRSFVQRSRAEFLVAKQGYVATRGGWISDRSVCYLASGRPVLTQDTGLADWLPLGRGVLAFRDLDEAVAGVAAIDADYEAHRRAARRLAEEMFAADKVVARLLEHAVD